MFVWVRVVFVWVRVVFEVTLSCAKIAFSRASGLVAKSNVAIVGPRVRFPAGAGNESRMM